MIVTLFIAFGVVLLTIVMLLQQRGRKTKAPPPRDEDETFTGMDMGLGHLFDRFSRRH